MRRKRCENRFNKFAKFERDLLKNNEEFGSTKGLFTCQKGDFRARVSSLRFPLMALYLFT